MLTTRKGIWPDLPDVRMTEPVKEDGSGGNGGKPIVGVDGFEKKESFPKN